MFGNFNTLKDFDYAFFKVIFPKDIVNWKVS